jgi:hypothetical protein
MQILHNKKIKEIGRYHPAGVISAFMIGGNPVEEPPFVRLLEYYTKQKIKSSACCAKLSNLVLSLSKTSKFAILNE